MKRFHSVALLALAVLATSCGGTTKHVRRKASQELTCAESQVHVTTVSKSASQYLAEACGRRAVYLYSRGQGAVRISEIEGANVHGAVPPPPPVSGQPPPPPPPPPAR